MILLVGAFDAFDEERRKTSGATANITKPFEPGALIDLVKSVLPGGSETNVAAEPEPSARARCSCSRTAALRHPSAAVAAAVSSAVSDSIAAEKKICWGLESIFKARTGRATGCRR